MRLKKRPRELSGFRAEPALVLPDPATFTEDEWQLARVIVGTARGRGAMLAGKRWECRVARVLGAQFPLLGTSPWDLRLPDGTLVEVRTGVARFSFVGDKQVDIWVFVAKSDPPEYFVATAVPVAALRRSSRTLSLARARELPGSTMEAGLLVAVKHAASRR